MNQIRRQHQHSVFKSTVRPFESVKRTIVEDLQQDVEDVSVCFFNLVKQYDPNMAVDAPPRGS